MTGVYPGFLVVVGSVAPQLQHLSDEVFNDSRQEDGGSGSDAFSVVSFAEFSVDLSNRELETRSFGARLGLPVSFSPLSATRHGLQKLET